MKKILLAVITTLSFNLAQAAYLVDWGNNQGGLTVDASITSYWLPNIGNQALFQLVWAGSDNTKDSIFYSDGSFSNDDQVLASVVFTNNAGGNERYALRNTFLNSYGAGGDKPFLGSSVYIRVFQSPTISTGVNFITSAISTVNNKNFSDPINPPTPDLVRFPAGQFFTTGVVQAIPEPGTLATIAGGLAVVVFGLRRRRYRI
jgi:hypothetical protein